MTDEQREPVAPSRASILGMVLVTFLTIYGTFWAAMTGATFDGRNLVGFLLGLLASVVMIGQTAGRFHRRLEITDAAKERALELRIQQIRARGRENLAELDRLGYLDGADCDA